MPDARFPSCEYRTCHVSLFERIWLSRRFACRIVTLPVLVLAGVTSAVMLPIPGATRFVLAKDEPVEQAGRMMPTPADISPSTPADIRRLIEKTFSADGTERWDAVKLLRARGRRATPAIPFLIRLLDDDFVDTSGVHVVRYEAQDTLTELRRPAVEPLIAGLLATTPQNKQAIVYILRWICDRRAVPALIETLRNPNPKARFAAADVLRDMPDKRAVEPLIALLHDKDPDVAERATYALGEIGDARALTPLLDVLTDRKAPQHVREGAAVGLAGLRDRRAFEPLLKVSKDATEPEGLRRDAWAVLGYTKDPRAFEILKSATESKEPRVWGPAISGLGGLADDRSVALLKAKLAAPLTQLRGDPDIDRHFHYRAHVAKALLKSDRPEAIDAVLAAFEARRDDPAFRILVAALLMMSPNPRAYTRAIAALKDDDPRVVGETAGVLATGHDYYCLYPTVGRLTALDDPRVVAPLMAIAKDKNMNETTRKSAKEALRKTDDPKALDFLDALENSGAEKIREDSED